MGATPILQIENLRVRHGATIALDQLDLQVDEGELAVLLGPSGCGKSTLLHAIAGLLDVASGSIRISGRDCTNVEPADRGLAMVFQSYALYPTLTVAENLSFALQAGGVSRQEVRRRVARVVDMLHLDPVLGRKPAALSGGQRQRVAIGRALVRETRMLLLDEPLSNLDAQLRAELRRELQLLHRRLGSTMVLVTHDQTEAMSLATRLVVMQGGKIAQEGKPEEVLKYPASRFVGGFLGSPPMNFLPDRDGRNWLGFRSSAVFVSGTGHWSGTVSAVECWGDRWFAWVDCKGEAVAVPVDGPQSCSIDDRLAFDIAPDEVLVYARDNGLLIRRSGG